jgi:hypothetical protein
VDGNATGIQGSGIILDAADYYLGAHTVTFTGKRGGNFFSQVVPFAVIQ